MSPESYAMRGGSKYLSARAAAEERAALAEENRLAMDERARQDRESREAIARMMGAGAAETRELTNTLKRQQIERESVEASRARTKPRGNG